MNSEQPLVLAVLTAILFIVVTVVTAVPAHGQGINRDRAAKVIERRLKRLERAQIDTNSLFSDFKRDIGVIVAKYEERMRVATESINTMILQTKEELCYLGASAYCPEPEEVVSSGHTIQVSFDVIATMYNNHSYQTDSSPCEGWAGNVCDAYKAGLNPIAASSDILIYPLGRHSRVTLESKSNRKRCKAMEGKVFTVMDSMSKCLQKNRGENDICLKPVKDKIDIFLPCEDGSCMQSYAEAIRFGTCSFTLTKL